MHFYTKWIRPSSRRPTLTHLQPQYSQLVRRNLDSPLAFSLHSTKPAFHGASRAKSMELGLTNKTTFFSTEHDSSQIEFLPFISVVLGVSACQPRGLLKLQINLLKPAGHVMHQQFNIQQLYVLPTLYLCVLYLSENKQRLVPLTA